MRGWDSLRYYFRGWGQPALLYGLNFVSVLVSNYRL